jgi:5'-deoxy-5'-methylthioadenosine phosphorylase
MRLGIIGGTGTATLFGAGTPVELELGPWGATSATLQRCRLDRREVIFLARHGAVDGPAIPPHRVNYRANIWAFRELGVDHVLGINAVGGIAPAAAPGRLVIPDQLIDYTWGRDHTYTGDSRFPLQHVDFSMPFSEALRDRLLAAGRECGLDLLPAGTYGATQGPRLETAAEINRLERDGCHVVGMTAMPEAALARELGLSYAICCVVVNQAAGRNPRGLSIHSEIAASLDSGMAVVRRLVTGLLATD